MRRPRDCGVVLSLLLSPILFAMPAFADFIGPIVSILDSDTIEVLHNNRAERIRLNRINCPNYSQVAPRNRVGFNSAAEAEEARYRVAGDCP